MLRLGDEAIQMNPNSHLSNTQIEFLDKLVSLVIENWRIDEQEYDFYKDHIEEWQKLGYYDDAMLYFWYYEPVEGLNSKQVDNFNSFIKVVNGLGFILPSTEQALNVNTLKYIERLKNAYIIEDKTEAILAFWQAINDRVAIDVDNFYEKFNLMRTKHQIIQDGNWYKFDKERFENSYQDILNKSNLWRAQYPKAKLGIYEQLIYDGESVEKQANSISYQYETMKLETSDFEEPELQCKNTLRSTMNNFLDWIKHL